MDHYVFYPNERPPQPPPPAGGHETIRDSVEAEVTSTYPYKAPQSLGEGVIIYIMENEFSLKPEYLDIETTRYERLPAGGADPFSKGGEQREDPREMHGTLVANVAAGSQMGAAPKARVVAVYRATGKKDGLKTALELIITHYDSQHEPRPSAIINASLGQASQNMYKMLGFNALEQSLECSSLIEILVKKYGILLIGAAGNEQVSCLSPLGRAEALMSLEHIITKSDRDEVTKHIKAETSEGRKSALHKLHESKLLLPAGHPLALSVGAHDHKDDCTRFYHGTGEVFTEHYFC
ncbi:uncharacterized protein KY384_004670 [Bacidia gigantensis]|uniref:uncharacterized protein n=1 Tax=Bacidia gigantensis TaxID=2732470 RepID=UPI001D03DAA1|nr:uncharacterized protein KY384_004670 [Bacidia gigantensis]KAG8530632.1 hypothetical protein KY384_004670 [Bacidia gigantensis]